MGRTEHALKHTARQCHPLWADQKTNAAVVKTGNTCIYSQCGYYNREPANSSVIYSEMYISYNNLGILINMQVQLKRYRSH